MIDKKDKIKLVITAEVTGSACNFDCNYCYRKTQSDYEKNIKPTFNYSVEHMLKAFSRKRIGGTAYVCVIGGGETLLPNEVVPFIKGLLAEGHVVELVTNLSLKNRVDELLEIPKEDLKRLLVKGSFHYLELKRLNKLDDYFNNMKKLIEAGASTYPLITIGEDYLPYLDEIKEVFINKLGELPHCIPAVKDFDTTMSPCDFYNDNFIDKICKEYNSAIFESFTQTVDIPANKNFCYAGERAIVVNLTNGDIRKCFYSPIEKNIFEDIKCSMKLDPIANNCKKPHCALLYSYLAFGIIPKIKVPNYSEMLNKKSLINEDLHKLINFKFSDYQKEYSPKEEEIINKKVKKDLKKLKEPNQPHTSFKNRIRLKIYSYLKTKLEKKGLI